MTAEQKKKSKELLGKLHAKYYGKKKSEPKTPEKMPEESKAADPKELSRNELMLQAKGIKNFRVINKQELLEILKEDTTQERITEIVAGAIARWKTGWGNKKQKAKA